MKSIEARIAEELGARDVQVKAAVELLDGGATVPFIARYRKEVTGGLDDIQLRKLEERLGYLRELEDRRAAIFKSIEEQGKMTDELSREIAVADTKARLEDLYLPFKPKRRTKAMIAREAGLEPLADLLLGDPTKKPQDEAAAYVNAEKGVADVKAALEGARDILSERFAEDADLLARLREFMWDKAKLVSKVMDGKQDSGAKFSDYFDAAEPIAKVPSHRALAMFRGQKEEILALNLAIDEPEDRKALNEAERVIAAQSGVADQGRAADSWLIDVVHWCWRVKLKLSLELDLMGRLRQAAEDEAVRVFASNLKDVLMSAPAGGRPTLGLDPGLRTGCKVAVIAATGKVLEFATIYPHEPKRQWDESIAVLAALCHRHSLELVAIGNGTASRETDKLADDLMKRHPELKLTKVMVSEAGASVYSASEYASKELPELDVTIRGAVSIARRLQDPLAELVKIDPKSIGVGQYQHDVAEFRLSKALDAVVEDCVNAVGVEVNTASAKLLARVSGLGESLAQNIVAFRDANGPFKSRQQLLSVPRLGPKAFEQAAGFLRIREGEDALDNSSVHPEAYPVVRRILAVTGKEMSAVIGDTKLLKSLRPEEFTDETFGVPTVTDIIKELEKPGRDPRPEFKTATFKEGVEEMKDLQPGMMLEGVVTNVAAFGAFVDIGVHQDGLVHVSALADRFVKDPREVVKPGDVVKVRVLEVDIKRKRISLTMRSGETPQNRQNTETPKDRPMARNERKFMQDNKPAQNRGGGGGGDNALAAAFAKAGFKK
ncbi:Tex family protein [Dongia rigui]|uniref:Tex family protein n=1 Tax=Dongia rigui TaxID=940149 RepID=A0ABU5DSV4_9PROT|nr:Tex family protein [Dongia rigui]MDY0870445.1 Tex family protein [Dongia rigui]